MPEYRVTFMVAPPQDMMWADSINVDLEEAITHSSDHDRVIEKVRIRRGVQHDAKIYVMSCTPANERHLFRRRLWHQE